MDKLCTRLTNTYNTTVLDDVDKITQAAFYSESKKHKGGKKGKTVLMDLIYNRYQGNKPKPSYIGGPKTLTLQWSDKYQKMFYIFGEWHSDRIDCPKVNCPPKKIMNPVTKKCVNKTGLIGRKLIKKPQQALSIEEYLEQLIQNTDAFIDAFFEFPAYSGEEYDDAESLIANGQRMEQLLRRFETCLQYSKRAAKKCRLARIHYFDIRKEESEGVNDTAYFRRKLQDATRGWDKLIQLKNLLKDKRIRTVLDGLNSPTQKEFEAFWVYQLDSNPYVTKELSKSPLNKEIYDFVKKDMLMHANMHRKSWQKNIQNIYNPKNNDIFVDAFERTYSNTVVANAHIPDAYTLARIFKDFDVGRDAYKGGTVDQPVNAHNIIIYAGNSHSDIYRGFLKSIGFEQLATAGSDNYNKGFTNCIDMMKFPQPFFSHLPENRGFFAKLFGWK
jgi:hypothetical protein